MTATDAATPVLSVETTEVSGLDRLIPLLDPISPLVWIRKSAGIAGIGEAVRLEFSGPDRIREAAKAWRELSAHALVVDPLGLTGTGLVAFGTFAFADDSAAASVLIVPELIIGKRDGRYWTTRVTLVDPSQPADVHPAAGLPAPVPFGPEYRIALLPGATSKAAYGEAVAAAVERIRHEDLDKVVLARDLVGRLPEDADRRRVLFELALGYPECWTFGVDGFIGASPETLVSVDRGTARARVLAGTISRGADADADHARAIALATSRKDLDEHRFAVDSVLDALAPHSSKLDATRIPFTLKLPNLWHLATDVEGTLSDGSSSLDLVAAMHPTAAVAGTPTADALALIHELEGFDRGRYAGPVGWVGADGDGEWAVALRCAQVTPGGDITAYAGCGIVSDSDPAAELAETIMKFRPIVEAFS